jgi:hypothetical protein
MINWPTEILQNKYTRWYEQIIKKAKEQNLSVSKRHAKNYKGYTEVHHIIPKSFGGSNSNENLVRFSAREHFICHWLLTKMTTGIHRNKMLTAFVLMTGDGSKSARYDFKITSSRVFEQIRTDYSKYVSEKLTGREISLETRAKISAANTGKTHTEEWKQRMSILNKGRAAPILTAEGRLKLGKWCLGKTYEELHGKEKAKLLKEQCKHVGADNGMSGKTHSAETRLKFKEYHAKPETKKLKSELVKGDRNPAKRPEVKEKISLSQKERLATQKLLGIGHYDPALLTKRKELSGGSNNGNAKTFRFTDPDGNVTEVTGGCKKFCEENKLNYSGIRRKMENNSCQLNGWIIQLVDKDK